MTFLLRNWRYVFIVLCAVALAGFGFYIRSIMAENARLKVEVAKLDEKVEIATLQINQCSKDKALTEKVSNDYQNANIALKRDLNRLRKNPSCVVPEPSSTPSVYSGTGDKLPSRDRIRTDWLYDFAGRAEQDRITGKACIDFMDQLYQSRGYNE